MTLFLYISISITTVLPNYGVNLVSSQSYNVVKYISYVPHIQLEGIKHEEIHCDAY